MYLKQNKTLIVPYFVNCIDIKHWIEMKRKPLKFRIYSAGYLLSYCVDKALSLKMSMYQTDCQNILIFCDFHTSNYTCLTTNHIITYECEIARRYVTYFQAELVSFSVQWSTSSNRTVSTQYHLICMWIPIRNKTLVTACKLTYIEWDPLREDYISWKRFPNNWLLVRGIHVTLDAFCITMANDVKLNKLLNTPSSCRWFDTPPYAHVISLQWFGLNLPDELQ